MPSIDILLVLARLLCSKELDHENQYRWHYWCGTHTHNTGIAPERDTYTNTRANTQYNWHLFFKAPSTQLHCGAFAYKKFSN